MARRRSDSFPGVKNVLGGLRRWWRPAKSFRHPALRLSVEQLEIRTVLADISGSVFQMLNVDGLFPEPSSSFLANVPGVTVSLNGGTPISAAGGTYSFTGVSPGTHTVAVQVPAGFVGFSAQSLRSTLVLGTSDFPNLNFALTPKNSALVQNLWEMVLSRPAGLNGFNNQLAILNPTASNAGTAFRNLWNSAESKSLSQPIGKLLATFFPGKLDVGMFRNAVQLQNLGVSQDATVLQIMYSQEFVTRYGNTSNLSNAAFVNFAYQRIFTRNPTNVERSALVSNLQNGSLNRGQVLLQLVNSAEFATKRPNAVKRVGISLAYLGVLGREVTPNQLQIRLNQLNSGRTLQFVANQLAQGNEFRNLTGFTDTFIWDALAHQIEPAVNSLSRMQQYDPDTKQFDIPVTANSLTSTAANPSNVYFIAHGWAPGLTEDVLLQSTPGNPLKWWHSSDSPWLLNGTDQISSQGMAQAIVDRDPLAKVVAYSWIDQSNTPEITKATTFTVPGNIVGGNAIVTGVNTATLVPGMTVTGPGMAIGAKVKSIDSASQLTLTQLPTASLAGVSLTYSATNVSVTTQNGVTTANSATLTGLNTSRLSVGMTVAGANIPLGAVIENILSSSSVLLSANATSSSAAVPLTFKGLDLDLALKQFLYGGQSESYTQLNGLRMAAAVQQALSSGFFGPTGQGLIHLLGHSHGSKVATVATLALQQASVPVAHLTTLESPEGGPFVDLPLVGTTGVHLPNLGGAENFLWYYMRQMNLSRNPVAAGRVSTNSTFIDNYYSKEGFGSPFGGFTGMSSFGPGADNLSSIVDVEMRPEILYGGFSASNPVGALEGLFGSHDYPPNWYGQAGLQAPSAPASMQNGVNWSPLLDPANTTGLSEFYTQPVSFPLTGNVVNNQATVTNIVPNTASLLPGMSVAGENIPAGTTILSIDSASQLTLSQPVTGTASGESLTFTYSSGQFVSRQFDLVGSSRPSSTAYTPTGFTTDNPTPPTPLAYAQQYTVGNVADTGNSITLTVDATNSEAINAITFNPLAAASPGFGGLAWLGAGMDMQVEFNGPVPAGEQVELVVWIRGMVSAPRVIDPDNTAQALTLGSTLGYISIPLLTLNGADTGTSTQLATISLGHYLNAFPGITGPFNSLDGANSAHLLPTLGFSLLGDVSSSVSVTVSNIRQFTDGIVQGP